MPLNPAFGKLLRDHSSEPLYHPRKVLYRFLDDGTRGLLRIHHPDGLTHIARRQLFGIGVAHLRQLIDLCYVGRKIRGIGSGPLAPSACQASVQLDCNWRVGLPVRLRERTVFRDPAARIFSFTVGMISALAVVKHTEHAEITRVHQGGDNIIAMGEGKQRKVDSETFAESRFNLSIPIWIGIAAGNRATRQTSYSPSLRGRVSSHPG